MILFLYISQERFDIHLLQPVNIYIAPATNKAIKYILAVQFKSCYPGSELFPPQGSFRFVSVQISSNEFLLSHEGRRNCLDEGCMLAPVPQHSWHISCASEGPSYQVLSAQRGHTAPQLGEGQL